MDHNKSIVYVYDFKGEPLAVECERCYSEEGSETCLRAAHQFKNTGNFMEEYKIIDNTVEMLYFDEYQKDAGETATYPLLGENLVYPALGLAGEAGECAEKIKKRWRNEGQMSAVGIHPETKDAIIKEMGDVLWYIAALCNELDVSMSKVASTNLEKLRDRRARNVIKSEGDNR